jgi:ABC-type spermidine/putrescine transport system permease subunit II
MTHRAGRAPILLSMAVAAIGVFVAAPMVVAIIVSFSSANQISFPPPGWSLKWYATAFSNRTLLEGIGLSAAIALAATFISTVLGTAAAIAINHHDFRGRSVVKSLLFLPLVLPAVVLGIAILFALPTLGIKIGAIPTTLGHCVIGVPYVTYLVLASLANYDLALERASATLGATRWQTFRWVTWPLIKDGIVAGAVFCFLLSFDNVALSLFLSRGDTLPLRLMQHIQFVADPSIAAISAGLVLLSFLLMLPLSRAMRRERLVW